MEQAAVLAAGLDPDAVLDISLAAARPSGPAAAAAVAEAAAQAASAGALRGQVKDWDAVRRFIFAGAAHFTLRSLRTGERFTYRVRVKKEDTAAGVQDPTYFVCWLRGPDNGEDYGYVGVLRGDLGLRLTAASRVTRTAPCVRGLVWFLDAMKHGRAVLGAQVEFWHEGRCGRCGRRLTVPESVAEGFGPECSGRRRAA